MKTFMLFILSAMLVAGAGFGVSAEESEPLPCDVVRVGLDAGKFFVYLTQDTPYTAWERWPDKGKLSPGAAPHGAFLTSYVNPAASQSIKNKRGMEIGSLIVMENYTADKRLAELSVMFKIKGYNPAAGDWYWFQYAPDGKALAAGRMDACIQCHEVKKANDYIMTAPVK